MIPQQNNQLKLLKLRKRLNQLSLEDSHTGLYNHRYLMYRIDAEFARAKRFNLKLSVMMMDLDYFKSINDTYGHRFGDVILCQFALQLKKILRKGDVIARFGGDEFVVILIDTDNVTAESVGQKIIERINEYAFGNKKYSINLRVSIGISSYPMHNVQKAIDLIDIADKHLNIAKELGGGRLVLSPDTKQEISKYNQEGIQVSLVKKRIANLAKRANRSFVEAIYALAKALEFKDRYSVKNVEKSLYYAQEIAKRSGFVSRDIDLIRHAAMLHDLGKIGIKEKVLFKKRRLSKSEFEKAKMHPQIAVDIIRPIHFLKDVIPWILHHHERWDGKGYPDGLKGEDIPLGSRIIAITDVYQALSSDRVYRKAYGKKKAINIIKEWAGTKFDPRLVDIFLDILQLEKKNKRA
ncbi:MAG: diguanylate cyclase [Candidatus Omnitrophica bacterium]|nr:diguanylate cyclase [Candidatus Omnitrophota bacterium]